MKILNNNNDNNDNNNNNNNNNSGLSFFALNSRFFLFLHLL